jgi:hypothetical protein
MRKVELQRGDRDETVGNRFQIGVVAAGMFDTMQAKPEIAIAARVASFDDRTARIVMKALSTTRIPLTASR